MKQVAIVGIQGVPAKYGGFETLVENMIGENCSPEVCYTIFCSGKDYATHMDTYKGARLKYVPLFHANGAQSTPYDILSMLKCLQLVNSGGDLEIDGEITGYNQYNESVDASGYSSKVKVTLTVNVRYTNNTNHEEDFEQQFSAFQTYDSSKLLTEVQDQLITLMVKDIAEQIFNATVANW